jgi:hypothetical protein
MFRFGAMLLAVAVFAITDGYASVDTTINTGMLKYTIRCEANPDGLWRYVVPGASMLLSSVTILIAFLVLRRDHERSRREKAVELSLYWSKNLNNKSSLARKCVEKLDTQQVNKLYNQEEIVFGEENRKLYNEIKSLLGSQNKPEDAPASGNCKLTSADCAELRGIVIAYLNMLESILLAWRHNVADTNMIEEEFKYMMDPAKEYEILKEFRRVAGGTDSYPSIALFCRYLVKKSEPPLPRGKRL